MNDGKRKKLWGGDMNDMELSELERKRKALYACAIRYSTEMLPLRERAIDSAVLCALLDSNEKEPLKIGQIQSIISFGSNAPALRLEIIKESLSRLFKKDKVGEIEVRTKKAYFIREKAAEELNSDAQTSDELLTRVIQRHTQNCDGPQEQVLDVCKTFLSECFARLGSQIAQSVVKGITLDDVVNPAEINDAFERATSGKSLSKETKTSLRIRCIEILKSTHPEDVQLKFYLTNCYYVVQLLGLEPKQFDPLAEQAFSGSVFYLDTNVLILGLLTTEIRGQLFEEVIRIARRLEIELRVTRATIDEARVAAAERISAIRDLLGMVPDEILKRTCDNFVEAFLIAREQNPAISPDDFFLAFDHISEIIPHWGIAIVEQTPEEILQGRDFKREAEVIQQVAKEKRRRGKFALTLNHDLAHYALIQDQRKENGKTWFLTRDGILIQAAKILAGETPAFCFSLLGFLQSISPFLTINTAQHTLASVFDKLLTEQIFPIEPLFEIRELHLLAEKDRDVLAAPEDQLIKAMEYAKSVVLKGQPYTLAEVPNVSLALRTYIVSDADLREKELIRTRDLAVQQAQRDQKEARKSKQLEGQALIQVQEKSAEIEKLRAEIKQLAGWIEESQKASVRALKRRRNLYRAGGILSGLCLWKLRDYLWQFVSDRWNLLGPKYQLVTTAGFGVAGLVIVCVSVWHLLRHNDTARAAKIVIVGAILAAILATFLKSETISGLADCLQIGGTFAAILVLLFANRRDKN
jgi:hypothetical protein